MGAVKKCAHQGACKHGVRPKKYPPPIGLFAGAKLMADIKAKGGK